MPFETRLINKLVNVWLTITFKLVDINCVDKATVTDKSHPIIKSYSYVFTFPASKLCYKKYIYEYYLYSSPLRPVTGRKNIYKSIVFRASGAIT